MLVGDGVSPNEFLPKEFSSAAGNGVVLRQFIFFLWGLLFFQLSSAQLLVLEVQGENLDTHATDVTEIACRYFPAECILQFGTSFAKEEYALLLPFIEKAQVVNLSLGFQKPKPSASPHEQGPEEDYQSLMSLYNEQIEVFDDMFLSHPQTLFVIAAGNGINMAGFSTGGVPLSKKYPLQPAYSDYNNTIKVASINKTRFVGEVDAETSEIMDYSNYSLTAVDVAAPVELDGNGQLLRGTSFAAPYVSRLAHKILNQYPQIEPQQMIELLIKSSYVVNIERAIEISQDYRDHGDESLWGRLEKKAKGLKEREALLREIGPILLVKSGGVVVESAALACARYFAEELQAIESACLRAQQEVLAASDQRHAQLQHLWRLRQL